MINACFTIVSGSLVFKDRIYFQTLKPSPGNITLTSGVIPALGFGLAYFTVTQCPTVNCSPAYYIPSAPFQILSDVILQKRGIKCNYSLKKSTSCLGNEVFFLDICNDLWFLLVNPATTPLTKTFSFNVHICTLVLENHGMKGACMLMIRCSRNLTFRLLLLLSAANVVFAQKLYLGKLLIWFRTMRLLLLNVRKH